MRIWTVVIQTLLIIIISPFLSGLITRIKNNIRMRKGASIFQQYYNIFKLLRKEEVVSENASWIFRIAPYMVLGSVVSALLLIPVLTAKTSLNYMGDIFVVIFLLALGRFFITLAGLDTGSSFGGMGSSREMFISSLVEPVALLAIFTFSLNCGSTGLGYISCLYNTKISTLVALFALFIVTIAETSRIPVDNQETHLELTMVHEAMVLEYSGCSLALIELASSIKQIIFYTLLANIIFPVVCYNSGILQLVLGFGVYLIKLTGICVVVSLLEVSVAKMRLFRVVDFLVFALVLSIIAIVASTVGL